MNFLIIKKINWFTGGIIILKTLMSFNIIWIILGITLAYKSQDMAKKKRYTLMILPLILGIGFYYFMNTLVFKFTGAFYNKNIMILFAMSLGLLIFSLYVNLLNFILILIRKIVRS